MTARHAGIEYIKRLEGIVEFVNAHPPARVVGKYMDTNGRASHLVVESHYTIDGKPGTETEFVKADLTSVREFLGY